jgi:hypothetical protein
MTPSTVDVSEQPAVIIIIIIIIIIIHTDSGASNSLTL